MGQALAAREEPGTTVRQHGNCESFETMKSLRLRDTL